MAKNVQPAEEMFNEVSTSHTPARMYKKAIQWFKDNGAVLKFDYSAKLQSFHSLYQYNKPAPLPGINYPSKFKCLTPASEQLLETLQDILYTDEALEKDEEFKNFITPLLVYRSGRSSEVTDHALGLEALKAKLHTKLGGGKYYLGIAHSPNTCLDSEIMAYVPEKDWFSEELQQLHFEDIVKIFPPKEAEMFKLIVGRALAGRTGSVHPGTGEVLQHGFRKAGVIVGEPGVGKTLTLNLILDGMKSLGYEVASMGDFGSRFNQGNVITSHLAYNDDLTIDTLERMLKAHSFKSVVTGGVEKVENKGTDAIEVVSNTVILANCNDWLSHLVYNIDSGAISRLAPISTYRLYELQEISSDEGHDVHPGSHIDWLCEKYNTTPIVISYRLLRDCVDFFLDKCSKDRDIHFYSESLMPYLRIQLHKNALENFIRFAFLCYAIRYKKAEGHWLPELTLGSLNQTLEATRFMMIDKRADKFRTYLKEHWEEKERKSSHPYWTQRKILITSVDRAYQAYGEVSNAKDVAIATERVFETLRLKDGFAMGHKISHITRLWESVKGEVNQIYSLADEMLCKLENADEVVDITNRANVEWIYDPSYDPQSV